MTTKPADPLAELVITLARDSECIVNRIALCVVLVTFYLPNVCKRDAHWFIILLRKTEQSTWDDKSWYILTLAYSEGRASWETFGTGSLYLDSPCGVWGRGWTTCHFSAHISKWELVCKFGVIFHMFIISCLCSRFHARHQWFFLLYNNLFIYQVLCTLIYRRRSLCSFLLNIFIHTLCSYAC